MAKNLKQGMFEEKSLYKLNWFENRIIILLSYKYFGTKTQHKAGCMWAHFPWCTGIIKLPTQMGRETWGNE